MTTLKNNEYEKSCHHHRFAVSRLVFLSTTSLAQREDTCPIPKEACRYYQGRRACAAATRHAACHCHPHPRHLATLTLLLPPQLCQRPVAGVLVWCGRWRLRWPCRCLRGRARHLCRRSRCLRPPVTHQPFSIHQRPKESFQVVVSRSPLRRRCHHRPLTALGVAARYAVKAYSPTRLGNALINNRIYNENNNRFTTRTTRFNNNIN